MLFCQHVRVSLFLIIFRLLFSLITKEKVSLVMVDKLCTRLKESRTDSVAHKCSYCLTLLSHSEKTIRRIIDHAKDFRRQLQIPEVHGSFLQLIAKLSKAANPWKAAVEELNAKVTESLRINEDGEEVDPPPASQQTQSRAKGRGGRGKKKIRRSYSDESEDEENRRPRRGVQQ